MKALKKALSMQRRFNRFAKEILGEVKGCTQCEMKIVGVSEAFTQVEDGKTYSYPETIEIKFENWSNSFYSLRTKDLRWVCEGSNLSGNGNSGFQILRDQVRELREFREHRDKLKQA